MAALPPSDASLLRRFQIGEQDAATELYRRYAARLLDLAANQTSAALGPRVDAEDIVQSVFRTFFRRAAQGEYDLPAGEDFWRLFLVIGLNKVRAVAAHHKAAKRDVRTTVGSAGLEQATDHDSRALAILRLTVEEVLAALPAETRAVVELRLEGHEVGAIAQRVGRARRSVERILHRVRGQLQAAIQPPG